MTRRSELEGVVRSWLRADQHEDADRVLDIVLAELDTTPQRHAGWLARRIPMLNNTSLRFGIAAAVLVAAALIGFNLLPGGVGRDPSSPTPTPSPTAPLTTPDPEGDAGLTEGAHLAAGTYLLGEPFAIPAEVTVPDGWFVTDIGADFALLTADADVADASIRPALGFWIVDFIPESCPVTGVDPTPQPELGPTVDDMATAIAERPGFASIEMTPTTLDGYDGVEMELRPALGGLDCTGGHVRSYRAGSVTRQQYPGDISRITILDVDGQIIVVDRLYWSENSEDATSPSALAELDAVYDSIDFAGP